MPDPILLRWDASGGVYHEGHDALNVWTVEETADVLDVAPGDLLVVGGPLSSCHGCRECESMARELSAVVTCGECGREHRP